MKSALSEKVIKGALRRTKGLVTFAAWQLGVSPELLRQRAEGTWWYWELLEEIRAELADDALWTVIQRMNAGDVRAAIWWLERFAQDRGYGRRRQTFEVLDTPEKRTALEELALLLTQTRIPISAPPKSRSHRA